MIRTLAKTEARVRGITTTDQGSVPGSRFPAGNGTSVGMVFPFQISHLTVPSERPYQGRLGTHNSLKTSIFPRSRAIPSYGGGCVSGTHLHRMGTGALATGTGTAATSRWASAANRQARRQVKRRSTRITDTLVRGGFCEWCDLTGHVRRLPADAMRSVGEQAVERCPGQAVAVVEDHDIARAIEVGVPPRTRLYIGAGFGREDLCAWAHGDTGAENGRSLIDGRLVTRRREWCAEPGWSDLEPWGSA